MKDGFLLVDKPTGISSFGALQQLNKRFLIQKNAKKLGHGGTLDPNASGLLVAAIGRATRMLRYFLGSDKRYRAHIRLGEQTTTDDTEGEIIARAAFDHITLRQVESAIPAFTGTITQIPPAFSALHVDGKRAYELARKGVEFELTPREVSVYRMDIVEFRPPVLELDIACSGGTYIRSIARDLGKALGTVACLEALRRTESCHFSIEQAHTLDKLSALDDLDPCIIPVDQGMAHFKRLHPPKREIHRLLNGLPANFHVSENDIYTVWFDGHLVAVLERTDAKNDYLRLMSAQEFETQFGVSS